MGRDSTSCTIDVLHHGRWHTSEPTHPYPPARCSMPFGEDESFRPDPTHLGLLSVEQVSERCREMPRDA